jgi:hypothetical protein
MTFELQSCARIICACAAGLMASAAMAQATTPAAPDAATVSATSSQIVVRDAASGQFRAATAAEAAVLLGTKEGAARARTHLNTMQKFHSSGGQGARLSDEFLNHSMVFVMPDGKLVEACFHTGADAATAHRGLPAMTLPAALPKE